MCLKGLREGLYTAVRTVRSGLKDKREEGVEKDVSNGKGEGVEVYCLASVFCKREVEVSRVGLMEEKHAVDYSADVDIQERR